MELKEYIQIMKKQAVLVVLVIVATIAIAEGYFHFRPESYGTSLIINVTRTGTQATPDFRYDDFYRLQADEKFTETLVQWLKSPRIALDIFNEAKIDADKMSLRSLSKAVRPEKMSSQVVLVSYSSSDAQTAKKISQAIVDIVSRKTEDLNRDQKDDTWFKILAGDPVIVKNQTDPAIIFWVSLALGFFLAFWAAMLKHYLR